MTTARGCPWGGSAACGPEATLPANGCDRLASGPVAGALPVAGGVYHPRVPWGQGQPFHPPIGGVSTEAGHRASDGAGQGKLGSPHVFCRLILLPGRSWEKSSRLTTPPSRVPLGQGLA